MELPPESALTACRGSEIAVRVAPTRIVLDPGETTRFSALVAGTWDKRVIWTSSNPSTLTQEGVFRAPKLGDFTVTAASQANPAAKATGSVQVQIKVRVSPEAVTLRPGQQVAFHAASSQSPTLPVTWSVLEGPVGGSITTEGLYTAPNRGRGAFHVLAQSTQDSRSRASATVTVPEAPVGRVAIAPGQVELPKGGSQTFVAVVEGLADPGLAWSCSGGSIDSTGHYTAPARFSTYRVTAASSAHPELRAEATVILAGGTRSEAYSYDLNGNLIDDGERSFQWDAENRLVAVVNKETGHRSEFEYDGFGRRVGIRELDPDANKKLQVSSDKKYLWDGTEIAEERSADGGTVLKRFYDQGFVDSDGTALFYTRDHLGSIRELTDGQQTVRARYDYDPYGRMAKIQGDKDSPRTYTGHFWHAQSGLDLTYYRAYDPNLGRWNSRDPIGERGGVNLYDYVGNDAINAIDPTGLRRIYGNWCGPNWTGGRVETYTPHEQGYYRPPIDSLDSFCMGHDICYYKCRKDEPCDTNARDNCFKKCDWVLTLGGFLNGLRGNPMGWIIGSAMTLHAGD
jgi:RHS repeat-associated protein